MSAGARRPPVAAHVEQHLLGRVDACGESADAASGSPSPVSRPGPGGLLAPGKANHS
jgi:hypothetical protein